MSYVAIFQSTVLVMRSGQPVSNTDTEYGFLASAIAAVYSETNRFMQIRLSTTTTTVLTREFFASSKTINRAELRFQTVRHGYRTPIKRVF